MFRSARHAFTLVELMVVVTIIIILLAFLAPAMETAIYQAELVRCAANQNGLADVMQFYAMDHRRVYPTNTDRRHTSGKYEPDILGQGSDPTRDLRPILFPKYVGTYDQLLCPLTPGKISLVPQDNDPATKVYANYFLFAGWEYPGLFGGKGMFRIGDRLGFADKVTNEKVESPVMVMDRYCTSLTAAPGAPFNVQGSHPSRTTELRPKMRSNQLVDDMDPLGDKATYSIWIGGPSPTVDINAACNDGSVRRFNAAQRWDPRFRGAQLHAEYTTDQSWEAYIPRN
jgi:prepilin-type N-terminal cleavage/methylation domain-containing protein